MNVRHASLPVLIPALILAVGAGCSDRDPVEPEPPTDLEFTYEGAMSGDYSSGGAPDLGADGLPDFDSWAIAVADSLGGLVIAGFQPTDENTGDVFILQLDPLGTGTFEPCDITAGAGCHGRMFVGVSLEDLSSVGEHFEVTSGVVTITEAGDERVQGTFDLTLVSQADGTRTLAIEGGSIDVPFSDDPLVGGGIACLARNLADGTNEPCS